jgi:hypothetical protein
VFVSDFMFKLAALSPSPSLSRRHWQVLVAKLAAGPRPLSLFMTAYPLRLACGVAFLCVLYGGWMGVSDGKGGTVPPAPSVVLLLLLLSNVHGLVMTVMFVAQVCRCV